MMLSGLIPLVLSSIDVKQQMYETSMKACRHGSDGVLVVFRDDSSRRKLMDMQLGEGEFVIRSFTSKHAIAARVGEQSMQTLMEEPSVERVEANCIIRLDDDMLDAPASYLETSGDQVIMEGAYGLDRIDSRLGRDGNYHFGKATGSNTRIYILDTGIRISHRDFEGRAIGGFSAGCPPSIAPFRAACGCVPGFCGAVYVPDGVITDDSASCNFHGTHVASVAGGVTWGVAKNTTLVSVQVLDCSGSGTFEGVIAGIEWARDDSLKYPHERSIISMSLGAIGSNALMESIVNEAVTQDDIPVVVAAGNDNIPACGATPARAQEALTVGATDISDMRAGFSNFGACIDIFAPGVAIQAATSFNDAATQTVSGTSQAAPHVSGAVAQLLQFRPEYSALEVNNIIKCMSSAGVVGGLDSFTPNQLLFAGQIMSQAAATSCMFPPPSPPPSPTYAFVTSGTCTSNNFEWITNSSECEDAAKSLGMTDSVRVLGPEAPDDVCQANRPRNCGTWESTVYLHYNHRTTGDCLHPDGERYDILPTCSNHARCICRNDP